MSNKWNTLRANRDARPGLPVKGGMMAYMHIAEDVATETEAATQSAHKAQAEAEAKAAAQLARRDVRYAVFGDTPVAATLVYASRRLMVYATRYKTTDTTVTYRKHRHVTTAALDTRTNAA